MRLLEAKSNAPLVKAAEIETDGDGNEGGGDVEG